MKSTAILLPAVLILASLLAVLHAAPDGEWEILFDGTSTAKWRGFKQAGFPEQGWEVRDGCLKTIQGNGPDIVTRDRYGDFELVLEWKISSGGNSGIMYRVSEEFDAPWHTGPEFQILDDARHADGNDPGTSAGSLYALIAPANKVLKPVGEWNEVRIIAKGNHVEHWLNGVKVVEYELGGDAVNTLIAKSKFKDMPRFAKERSGLIDLQHHHDEAWFRNIRIRRLN